MKKTKQTIIIFAGAVLFPLLMAGCSMIGEHTMGEFDDLQGHWVDVNGDTTLDFNKNKMTVLYVLILFTFEE